jgi:hypothetical protein
MLMEILYNSIHGARIEWVTSIMDNGGFCVLF